MRILSEAERIFSMDSIKKESALWKEEDLEKDFQNYFASVNSRVALVLLPATFLMGLTAYIIGILFEKYNIHNVGVPMLSCYIALCVLSVIFYFSLLYLAKRHSNNSQLILNIINIMVVVVDVWMLLIVNYSSSMLGSVIVYATTVSVVTQALYLSPRFSAVCIFGCMTVYGLMKIFDGEDGEFETDAILGIVIMSVLWYMVSYLRYYNRCRAVYNEKIIFAQNERLDDIINELKENEKKLSEANEKLEKAYVTDRLTGVYNRWYWEKFVGVFAEDSIKNKTPVSAIMLDLDNFKQINDTYGHGMGDDCLVGVSQVIKNAVKDLDNTEVFRMGGEEFVIVCPVLDKAGVLTLANEILKEITNVKIPGLNTMLTASIGVHISNIQSEDDINLLITKADVEMYKAKTGGKNRISFSFT